MLAIPGCGGFQPLLRGMPTHSPTSGIWIASQIKGNFTTNYNYLCEVIGIRDSFSIDESLINNPAYL
jgi:hypothetical protein